MSKLDDAIEEALEEGYGGSEDVPIIKKKKKKHRLDDVDPTAIPAGHARDEALAEIADELAEKAESNDEERFRLDPAKFVIENEIGAKATSLDVSNAQADRVYFWARFKAEHGVSQVDQKRSLTIGVREIATGKTWKEHIWYVVEGTDKEAMELRQADGTRRLGDVLLLWCKRNVHAAVCAAAEEARRRWMGAPMHAARAFEAKTGIKIITETEMAGDPRFEKIAKHAESNRRENLAEQTRVQHALRAQQKREQAA